MNLQIFKEINPGFDLIENTVFLTYRGSICHGTHIPIDQESGTDDIDLIGIVIPPLEYFFSLKKFEQCEFKKEEYDSIFYEFRKFILLLSKSNPNVISMFWLSELFYLKSSWISELLICNRKLFSSKFICHSFLGYANSQLNKLNSSQKYHGYMGSKRKAIVDKFGYDVKNASHLIRLLRMCKEFLLTEQFFVDRSDIDAKELIAIKKGEWELGRVLEESTKLFIEVDNAANRSKLPEHADLEKINNLCEYILSKHFNLKEF